LAWANSTAKLGGDVFAIALLATPVRADDAPRPFYQEPPRLFDHSKQERFLMGEQVRLQTGIFGCSEPEDEAKAMVLIFVEKIFTHRRPFSISTPARISKRAAGQRQRHRNRPQSEVRSLPRRVRRCAHVGRVSLVGFMRLLGVVVADGMLHRAAKRAGPLAPRYAALAKFHGAEARSRAAQLSERCRRDGLDTAFDAAFAA
jgi:hypothetical protein